MNWRKTLLPLLFGLLNIDISLKMMLSKQCPGSAPIRHMIFGLAIKREYIKPLASNQALYSVTTETRELLFRKGLLRAHT